MDPIPSRPHGQEALAHFRQCVGKEATFLSYAPGRVNLIGEYTDFNGGYVLPMAISQGVYAAASPRTDGRVRLWSARDGCGQVEFPVAEPGRDPGGGWTNYVRGVLAGLNAAGVTLPGFDGLVYADLPAGGGLSSSAALETAVATLGEALAGVVLDPVQKALLCQKAEHEYAGTPCGIMDQFAVTFAKRGHFLLIDCASLERTLVPMPDDHVAILVINTMVRHSLNDGAYRARRADCEEGARLMGASMLREVNVAQVEEARESLTEQLYRRARHVTSENVRTLAAVDKLKQGNWNELGQLLYASHASLRDDMNVSCDELDVVVEAARRIGPAGGVYGCRMTGGGFGGCCIALVQATEAADISAQIIADYLRITGITPTIFSTKPSDGAAMLMQPLTFSGKAGDAS